MQATQPPSWRITMRRELPALLALAGPVVMAELGWMAMGVVDTIMVGRLGAAAIGAVSLGSVLYHSVAIFGTGLLLGLDTLVAQAYGAGRLKDCHHSLWQGVYLSLLLTPVLTGLALLAPPFLAWWGVPPEVEAMVGPYVRAMTWGTLPLLGYATCRRYLQGMGRVWPVMFALVSANLVNWAFNWILIEGHWGAPAMGVEGSGWSTSIARIYMVSVLAMAIAWYERREPSGVWSGSFRPDPARLRELLRLGLPAASQITLEVGVFAAATVLAGKLSPQELAAHQIALNSASVAYMVPLGIASAAAVSVGQALGRQDAAAAWRAGWTALALGAAFMLCAGLAFILVPRALLEIYTTDGRVLQTGIALLAVAAVFQLFDGVQTVAIGVLRGTGNTRTPMIVNLVGYWLIGLPLGTLLCFVLGWGVVGIWIGLCVGLLLVALALLRTWMRWGRHAVAPL